MFGLVTAAHILTQQTKGLDVERHEAKWLLARKLFERDWDRQRIVDLFNIIDWMMKIPKVLQLQLMEQVTELERSRNMPYISSFERLGREKGRVEGQQELLRLQLEKRFGKLPPSACERLENAQPTDIRAWADAVLDAPTLDSVFARR